MHETKKNVHTSTKSRKQQQKMELISYLDIV